MNNVNDDDGTGDAYEPCHRIQAFGDDAGNENDDVDDYGKGEAHTEL